MRVLRPIIIGSLVSALFVGAVAPSAGADTVTDDGVGWLATQQQANGGFEVAGFDGFETPDAILAIAANAQTTATWSTSEALAAVEAVDNAGVTALDWVDAWVDGELTDPPLIGQEAKLILQVAVPLGFDPTDFDPGDDDAPGAGVDLTAGLDENAPALFNSFLFARLAESLLAQNVHQADLQVVCESEKATGGGWSFDGDPAGANSADLDTTGFAVMALVAAGIDPSDPVLEAAETFVLGGLQANGSWASFGSDDPNATALAMFAVTALGGGLDDLAHDPVAWLQSQQLTAPPADDGRFASPNDGFGVNTFATSQAVQALLLDQDPGADWLPVTAQVSSVERRCLPAAGFADVPAGAWYDDGARWVDDAEIVGGINGDLRPPGRVNRAQAAMWLNGVFGSPGGAANGFTDVPDGVWYEDGVDFVASAPNGTIASGFGDQFRPQLSLNRAQAVSWLYAAAGSPDVSTLPPHGFTDVRPTTWFRNAARWAAANDIVLGFPNGTFRGNGDVTRAQFAQWMFNLVATPEAWPLTATTPPTLLFSVFP